MDGKTAAIALTLIIAVPILLGYALNITEEERTGYETTEYTNITEAMLNSSAPIYITSAAPVNNQLLYAEVYYIGVGTEYSLIAPGYNTTSATYTSIPVITNEALNTISLSSANSAVVAGQDISGSSVKYYTASDVANYGYVKINPLNPNPENQVNIGGQSYAVLGESSFIFLAADDGVYLWDNTLDAYQGLKGSSVTVYAYEAAGEYDFNIVTRGYTDIAPTDGDNNTVTKYYFSVGANSTVRVTHTDGTVEYCPLTDTPDYVYRDGANASIGGAGYTDVSALALCADPSISTVSCYTYTERTDLFANPSDGWNLSKPGAVVQWAEWLNGSINQSIRLLMDIEAGESVTLEPRGASSFTISRSSAGMVTAENSQIGNYRYLCLDIFGDKVTISGINAWPTLNVSPTFLNSVTLDYADTVETFTRVKITGNSTIDYRVDNARILNGSFALTEDYTLDIGDMWPDKDVGVVITSAGIYGDTLAFGGNTYTVNNGRITIDGVQVPILKSVFSCIYDETTQEWSNQINGMEISQTADPSAIYYGGQWSITASAYKMEEVTSTSMVWHAGEFAFNGVDSNFALIGLITCAGVFIALGIYGRRSGAKVGSLMLICGCAAFIFLALM